MYYFNIVLYHALCVFVLLVCGSRIVSHVQNCSVSVTSPFPSTSIFGLAVYSPLPYYYCTWQSSPQWLEITISQPQ